MKTHQSGLRVSRGLVRLTGIAAIGAAVSFLPGARMQHATGWFPLDALETDTIEAWLTAMEGVYGIAVAGVWLSLIGIVFFALTGLGLYRMLRDFGGLSTAGLAGYLLGVPLAFAAFLVGLSVTWELVPAAGTDEAALIAEVLMRFMLVGDDLATLFIIGLGNGCFAVAAYRAGWLPRWLLILGLAAPTLWALNLLGYFIPPLQVAVIGAPLALVWYLATGIVILRATRRTSIQNDAQ